MNEDFLDLLRALSAADARFLIVGAYAVAIHGRPRATGDLDVWVKASRENASKVLRGLKEFGAPLMDLTEEDLASEGVIFQVGLPPRRIDILTALSGIQFDSAWGNRVSAQFGPVKVFAIGLNDLITNKRAAGRPKDLVDVAELERLKK